MDFEQQINLILDYEETEMTIDILNEIEKLDFLSFPNFVKKIYCINTDTDQIIQDEALCEFLKTDFYDEKLEILADDYETYIFDVLDCNSVSVEYYGNLNDHIFDLNELIIESLNLI